MSDDKITIQEVTGTRLVCQLEDVLDLVEDGSVEPVARKVIGDTLNLVQQHFYLVPKHKVTESGSCDERAVPEDTLVESIADIWNNVSN